MGVWTKISMHLKHLDQWIHEHRYSQQDLHAERKTSLVIALTTTMMVLEIAGGWVSGSMALLADGWHMGTHASALGITVFAYRYARKHQDHKRFTFGTGKVSVLGGYTSAVVLAIVALLMVVESFQRLLSPVDIRFSEAIGVAVLGLVVNLLSAWMLQHSNHEHHHGHSHPHHHDHNLRAAYIHVLADALTSVLAILALLTGKYLNWHWMDPIMGIVGAGVILIWAYGLVQDTSQILLDCAVTPEFIHKIREKIESDADNRVADLHVWIVGQNQMAAILSIVTHDPKPVSYYHSLLTEFEEINHLTIEVHRCPGDSCKETG